jgi:predicted dehydrogenase
MRVPLRIRVLGAARIADEGIVDPARALGHDVVAVAARDRGRAEAFARPRGIEVVHDTYADVVHDPRVDLVYNALVNSEHTRWNLAALAAGKHVLSEKPLAPTAAEAREVPAASAETGARVLEGFHYLHHPVSRRLRELVETGALGDLERVDIVLDTPPPPGHAELSGRRVGRVPLGHERRRAGHDVDGDGLARHGDRRRVRGPAPGQPAGRRRRPSAARGDPR